MKSSKKNHPRSLSWAALAAAGLFLGACTPADESAVTNLPDAESSGEDRFLLADAPDQVPGLLEALEAAGPEESFTFTGRVGGTIEPLSADYAGFVVADERVWFCDEGADDDHCSTPWDACCEDPDKLASSLAFVQFTDGEGNPLPVNLREAVQLSENDTVVVRGRLAPGSSGKNRVILAEGLAIRDRGP
jgi:hypothetical protein